MGLPLLTAQMALVALKDTGILGMLAGIVAAMLLPALFPDVQPLYVFPGPARFRLLGA